MPRDCTAPPTLLLLGIPGNGFYSMNSPHVMGIPYMTNKSKVTSRNKKVPKPAPKPKQKKATPFADSGEIIGQRLGNFFGLPMLKGVGKWLGSGIGSILGSGDYTLVGSPPKYNLLASGQQTPQFASDERTNIVCHREFIATIAGSSSFTNYSFDINPSNPSLFPWLSNIAANYSEYRVHGMLFEFRSLTTDYANSGAPGVVVWATNYNSALPAYTSKVAMENSEFATAVKPTQNLMHMIECDMSQTPVSRLYVSDGGTVPTGQDPRLYNLGKTQFATQGGSNVVIGELWVSYCIEFFKPKLSPDVSGVVRSTRVERASLSNSNPLGLVQVSYTGDSFLSSSGTQIGFNGAYAGQSFLLTVQITSDTPVAFSAALPTFTNCTYTSVKGYNDTAYLPSSGTTTSSVAYVGYVTVSTDGVAVVTFPTGTWPTSNASVLINATQLSSTV